MKVLIIATEWTDKTGHTDKYKLVKKGIEANGDTVVEKHIMDLNNPIEFIQLLNSVDVAWMWGMSNIETQKKKNLSAIIEWDIDSMFMQIRQSIPYVVMERGFTGDRCDTMFSVGWNGLNGEANHLKEYADNKRLHHIENLIKPWRTESEGIYTLIIGQMPMDTSLTSVDYGSKTEYNTQELTKEDIDFNDWIRKQVKHYEEIGVVQFRPHPGSTHYEWPWTLEEQLNKASRVVTYSSTVGVESVLAGIPTVATHSVSMVYNLLKESTTPDRTEWFNELTYSQWTLEEIEKGETWNHLRKRVPAISAAATASHI